MQPQSKTFQYNSWGGVRTGDKRERLLRSMAKYVHSIEFSFILGSTNVPFSGLVNMIDPKQKRSVYLL